MVQSVWSVHPLDQEGLFIVLNFQYRARLHAYNFEYMGHETQMNFVEIPEHPGI